MTDKTQIDGKRKGRTLRMSEKTMMQPGTVGIGSFLVLAFLPNFIFGNPSLPSLFAVSGSGTSEDVLTRQAREEFRGQKLEIRNRSIEKESCYRATDQRGKALLAEAESAFETGRPDRAKQRGEEALRLNPKDKRAGELLGKLSGSGRGPVVMPSASLGLVEEDVADRTHADPENILSFHLRRAEYFLKAKRYDEAIEDLEQIFMIDPGNLKASGTIDGAKRTLIREAKEKAKSEGKDQREPLAELFDVSLETARQLEKEKRFVEAKILLNRIALIEPRNKKVERLMRKIQKEEKKRG